MSNEIEEKAMKPVAKRALEPKLRFPEFREAGEWSKEKIGAVATLYKGKGISKAEIVANGVQPCIRYGELYTIYGETIHETVSSTNVDASELFLSKKNDVIIPASGETKIDIAKASCVMSDDVALGGDLNVIRSSQNGIFLSYQLNGPLRLSIAKVAQGDTVVHLYPSQIERLDVLVPSPIEQQKIADCLSSLDELIAARAQKLDTLKTHKKGLMQQLFPRDGETLPRLRFPEFRDAKEWDADELGEVAEFVNEKIPLEQIALENYISTENILPDYGGVARASKLPAMGSVTRFKPNDTLVSNIRPYLKKVWVADKEGGASNDVIVIRAKQRFLPQYFSFLLKNDAFIDYVMTGAKGVKMPRGDVGSMKKYPALYPSKTEQQKIADCLSSLDDLIAAQTQKLDTLKIHKKGLMQQLFPSFGGVDGEAGRGG